MGVFRRVSERDAFEVFVERVQPRLLQALVATYGPVDGREACVDALSWAWEHRDRLEGVEPQVADRVDVEADPHESSRRK